MDDGVKPIAGNIYDAAKMFGVSVTTIRRWVKAGVLRPVQMRPRGDLLFDLEAEKRRFRRRAVYGGSGMAA
jgi:predicted site-specific integrase-resolvase